MPKGSDILIDDVPIGEYYAAKLADIRPGERESIPEVAYRLAGSRRIEEVPLRGRGEEAGAIQYRATIRKNKIDRQTEIDVNLKRETDKYNKAKQLVDNLKRRNPTTENKRLLAIAQRQLDAATKAREIVEVRISRMDSTIEKNQSLLKDLYLSGTVETPEGARTIEQIVERDGLLDFGVRVAEDGSPLGVSAK